MTTPIANGQGQCALRDSRLQEFNRDLVARAFLEDGLCIDLSPEWNDLFRIWEVSATDDRGNAEAIAGFFVYAEALQFIDGLCLLLEMKGKTEALSNE